LHNLYEAEESVTDVRVADEDKSHESRMKRMAEEEMDTKPRAVMIVLQLHEGSGGVLEKCLWFAPDKAKLFEAVYLLRRRLIF
jgi:hypothetical protein